MSIKQSSSLDQHKLFQLALRLISFSHIFNKVSKGQITSKAQVTYEVNSLIDKIGQMIAFNLAKKKV